MGANLLNYWKTICIISIVFLISTFLISQGPTITQWHGPPPQHSITASMQPVSSLTFYWAPGLYTTQHSMLESDLNTVLTYVKKEGGFENEPTVPFEAAFMMDSNCALRGVAYTKERRVQVFTCNTIPSSRAVAILAHEFVHQLAADRYGDGERTADSMLAEGLATWAAGKYWLGEYANFHDYVKAQRERGNILPLRTRPTNVSAETMDMIYYQWASFVEYLVNSDPNGRDKFNKVYGTGNFAPGSADYQTVYHVSIEELEQRWLAWLDT